MRLTPDVEKTVRRYVLGDLDEVVRQELEEMIVTDPEAFEALGIVEDELVEEYLEDTLSPDERRGLEQLFLLSPEGQRRLRFARALKGRASSHLSPQDRQANAPPSEAPAPRPVSRPVWIGLAAALALSLVGNVWQLSLPRGSDGPVPPASAHPVTRPVAESLPQASPGPAPTPAVESAAERALRARLESEQSERAKAETRAQALERQLLGSVPRVVTFALTAGLLRGEGSLHRVTIPAGAPLVSLRLELSGDDYPRYRATLVDADGNEIWAASRLKAEHGSSPPAIVCPLPSGLLARGDYQLKLVGLGGGEEEEAVGTYSFRVIAP